jgi:hypothetical protein
MAVKVLLAKGATANLVILALLWQNRTFDANFTGQNLPTRLSGVVSMIRSNLVPRYRRQVSWKVNRRYRRDQVAASRHNLIINCCTEVAFLQNLLPVLTFLRCSTLLSQGTCSSRSRNTQYHRAVWKLRSCIWNLRAHNLNPE